jgi:hypothetical protein
MRTKLVVSRETCMVPINELRGGAAKSFSKFTHLALSGRRKILMVLCSTRRIAKTRWTIQLYIIARSSKGPGLQLLSLFSPPGSYT